MSSFETAPEPTSGSNPPPPNPMANPSTTTPVATGRTLLIHGYSASAKAFQPWKEKLAAANVSTLSIEVGNYVTLNNEVTLKDLGEAFDRALRYAPWSTDGKDDTYTFDAVVHSTGMLVLRQWLISDPFLRSDPRSRVRRLKHLVGLAPATFGSPQAKQGRSFLGALVKGNRHFGPDFLNAGDEVLAGLELASNYTWDLAHKDMLGDEPLYDKGNGTPYVAVFIGNSEYTGFAQVANSPGCDGTVRWAGCALNTRKVSIDFRREPKLFDDSDKSVPPKPVRFTISPWESGRLDAPVIAVEGKNHGTILDSLDDDVSDIVCALMKDFFLISDEAAYIAWQARAQAAGKNALKAMDNTPIDQHPHFFGVFGGGEPPPGAGWQQIVVHVVDDHGDGVPDFNLKLFTGNNLTDSDIPPGADDMLATPVPIIADTFSRDSSYRCFYIRLSDEMMNLPEGKKMWLELIASSGSNLIEYEAYTGVPGSGEPPLPLGIDHLAVNSIRASGNAVKLDLTKLATGTDRLLFPYTTTLLEIFVEREPVPLGQITTLFGF